jgi:hypothetical protein
MWYVLRIAYFSSGMARAQMVDVTRMTPRVRSRVKSVGNDSTR